MDSMIGTHAPAPISDDSGEFGAPTAFELCECVRLRIDTETTCPSRIVFAAQNHKELLNLVRVGRRRQSRQDGAD